MKIPLIAQFSLVLSLSILLSSTCIAETFQNELSLLKDIPKSHAKRYPDELNVLLEDIVQGKKGPINKDLTLVDAKFLQQFPDGSFSHEQLNDEIYLITSIVWAFEALKEDPILWPNYKIKIGDYYPRIQLALEYIYQNRDTMTAKDNTAPDRLLSDANLFFLTSKLTGKKDHLDFARSLQAQGLALLNKNSNNQCVSLIALMHYVTAYPNPNLYKEIKDAESWQVAKILPDGSFNGEDSLEALQMFDYYAALFTDQDTRDIAKKIYYHIATTNPSKSKSKKQKF